MKGTEDTGAGSHRIHRPRKLKTTGDRLIAFAAVLVALVGVCGSAINWGSSLAWVWILVICGAFLIAFVGLFVTGGTSPADTSSPPDTGYPPDKAHRSEGPTYKRVGDFLDDLDKWREK